MKTNRKASKSQPKSRWVKPVLERLEDRTLLNGNAVAFFVAGYGGQNVPFAAMNELATQFSKAYQAGIIHNYDIYWTNWNSPDPTSDDYASSHNPTDTTGNSRSGNPGSTLDNLIQATTTGVLGTPVFNGLVAQNDPNAPNPSLPTQFVDGLTNILNTQYDDKDFVALVGHSFGGNSVLRVANQTTRKIDLLATLDPVGWSNSGVFSTDNAQIIPPITVPIPNILGGGTYTLFNGLSIPVPVGALGNIFSSNLFDPVYGLPGYRNELESPGSNVRYFYNRYQNNFPFPFDYQTSGTLNDSQVQHSVDVFSYGGTAVSAQQSANDFRDDAGNPVLQPLTGLNAFLNILWGYSHVNVDPGNVDFGSVANPKFPPDFSPPSISFDPTSRMTHQDLPLDTFINDQLAAIFDGVAPSRPTANAGPDQNVNEGDTVALNGAAHANDPNSHLAYQWALYSGPTKVTLFDSTTLNPTFVTPDGGDYIFQLTVTNTDTGIVSDPTDPKSFVTIHVANLAPVVGAISGPSTGVRGFSQQFSVGFSDPGYLNTFTGAWGFGDSQGIAFRSVSSPDTVSHTYTGSNTYTVTATIQDDEGAQTSVSTQITIKGAGLIPDPTDPGKTALAVGGTTGDDTIVLQRGPSAGQVHVTVNGTDEGTYTPTGHILIDGFSGNDKLTLDFSNGGFISPDGLVWDGGTGSNTLAILGRANVWTVTDHNQGFVNGGITFVNTQSLTGGDETDQFIFQPAGYIDENITGGGGYDTLDLGALSSQYIHLSSDDATGFTGFTKGAAPIGGFFYGIDDLIGSSGMGDMLYGIDVNSQWNITASGPFHYTDLANNHTLDFSNIQNLTGGSGADTFVFSVGATIGMIDGGDGNNAIDGANQTDAWNITGANAGSITSVLTSFANIQTLAGGTGADTFSFSVGGTMSSINGGGGNDTIDGANQTDAWNITAPDAGSITGVLTSFVNIQNLVGGSGNDTFLFRAFSMMGTIDGGSGANAIDGPNEEATWNVTGPNRGDIEFVASLPFLNIAFEAANSFQNIQFLVGGSGDDTFIFSVGATMGTVDGGGGANAIDGANQPDAWYVTGPNAGNINGVLASFVNIQTLAGGTVADAFFVRVGGTMGAIDGRGGYNVLGGPDANETWNVTGPNQGNIAGVLNSFQNIQYLLGGVGDDTFLFAPGATEGMINGGYGNNTIVGADDQTNDFYISGGNAGNIVGVLAMFGNVQNLAGSNAPGNSGTDVFMFFQSGGLAGQVMGGSGSEWLDYNCQTTSVQVNLAAHNASRVGGGVTHNPNFALNVIGSAYGGDTLIGDATGGVLEGCNTNNTIIAGSGRSILIGGYGRSLLEGNAADDLILNGSTYFGFNIQALTAFLAEWQSGDNFATRVYDIRVGLGQTEGFHLALNSTVFCPPTAPGTHVGRGGGNGQSTLLGQGGQNWFFTLYPTDVADLQPTDVVD